MPGHIEIVNWEKFQNYQSGPRAMTIPPWIKLHRSLLDNYEFSSLNDASKLLLFMLWMLAACKQNAIPCDVEWIKWKSGIKGDIDLEPLVSRGFIKVCGDDSNMLADGQQAPSIEKRRVDKIRGEERRSPQPPGESVIEKITKELSPYPPDFEEFWTAYPKKRAKGSALKAWKASKKNGHPPQELILEAVDIQSKSQDWTKDGGKFIPHPATWINGKRWDDDVEDKYQPPTEEEAPF